MRTIFTIFIIAAFVAAIFAACQNPTEKGKGNIHKDLKDTIKTKDSTQAPKRVNPEDTIRKY
ncbi:hypothetical protein [Pedobacter rhizosphaerae]|uniref:Lipoprotein n=1 Tax=Pedobacter rhizosphaerae TaxID=390241 RepID=A0A1H9QWN4_9SPHI|nr:hypothetical protein [Pedobacter rhizosphaerae]SER64645.1 hypothetical protein SAMN04488023_1139 [Pedobacter rhizosphaerae]